MLTFLIFKIIFRDQIQCQSAQVPVLDSSLMRINILTNEHLMYYKIMVSWLTFGS